jgi:solute carrier family 25 phosphate transporter 3
MQTADHGTFPRNFAKGFNQIYSQEGWNGLYKGLKPLWMRQVPYTMVKFSSFESTVKAFYKYALTAPKDTYSKATQLSVTFMSGYFAGIFCAIVSHPADTMVSILNKKSSNAPVLEQVKGIYGEIGFNGLWNGLGARIIMVGTLTGLQWWIYDSFKVYCGLHTTGGK